VGGLAIAIALGSGSLSLLGFGVDAAVDAAASVALIWRFLTETRHPARAARAEALAERLVGAFLAIFALYLVAASVQSLASSRHTESTGVAVALLVASVALLPPLAILKLRTARQLGSRALRADSILTGVAAVLAAATLLGLVASAFGLWWADQVAALFVAVVLLREGAMSVAASLRKD
jgi:divalent metal cation (Fe/Co/Zn/Cd) transporter